MADIWEEYQKNVDEEELNRQIEQARKNSFEDLPAGTYNVELSHLEQKLSKTGKPMVSISMKVLDGRHRGRLMFMNRVIGQTKNDGRMIGGMESWLAKLGAEDEKGALIPVKFHDYPQFNRLIMDIKEAVDDMSMEYEVEYDSKEFDAIKILRILD